MGLYTVFVSGHDDSRRHVDLRVNGVCNIRLFLEIRHREGLVEVGLEKPRVELYSNERQEKQARDAGQYSTRDGTVATAPSIIETHSRAKLVLALKEILQAIRHDLF